MNKKACENCGTVIDYHTCEHFCESEGLCDQWQRDPHLWLSILPEEPGWYWYRKGNRGEARAAFINGNVFKTSWITARAFQWQGPIAPEGE